MRQKPDQGEILLIKVKLNMNIPILKRSPLNVNFVTKDFLIMNTYIIDKQHSNKKSVTKDFLSIEP